MSDSVQPVKRHASAILRVIAVFKLVKAILMLGIGITALKLMHKDLEPIIQRLAEHLHVDPDSKYVHWLISRLTGVPAKRWAELGVGAFFYSATFMVEGIGLL